MQWNTAFYANHSLTMLWMPVGRKMQNTVFYRTVHNFLMVILVSRTYHISYKWVSNKFLKVEHVFLKVKTFMFFIF